MSCSSVILDHRYYAYVSVQKLNRGHVAKHLVILGHKMLKASVLICWLNIKFHYNLYALLSFKAFIDEKKDIRLILNLQSTIGY